MVLVCDRKNNIDCYKNVMGEGVRDCNAGRSTYSCACVIGKGEATQQNGTVCDERGVIGARGIRGVGLWLQYRVVQLRLDKNL